MNMGLVKERNFLIGITALLAVVVFGVCCFTAAMYDQTWVFGKNYFSDFGVSTVKMAALFFNEGCVIAGTLLAICGVGMAFSRKRALSIAGGICILLAGIGMVLIGFIHEDQDAHVPIALAMFGIGLLGLIIISVADWMRGLRALASLTLFGIVLVVLSYILIVVIEVKKSLFVGMPGVETVAIILMFILLMLQGMKFLYNGAFAELKDGKGISDRHRLGLGFTAVLATVLFVFLLMFAIMSGTSWTFGTDQAYLLGLPFFAGDEPAFFFALACIVSGAFTVIYGIGAGMMHNGTARSVSGFFIILLGAGLGLMGITYLVRGDMWEYAENVLIALGILAMICITVSDWMKKKVVFAAFYMILFVSGVASLAFFGYESSTAYWVLIWFAVFAIEGMRLIPSNN